MIYLYKNEKKIIKFNISIKRLSNLFICYKDFKQLCTPAFLYLLLKSPFLKFFSNNKGTSLHRFSQRLNNKLHEPNLSLKDLNGLSLQSVIKKGEVF